MHGWGIAKRRRKSLRFSGRSLKELDEFSAATGCEIAASYVLLVPRTRRGALCAATLSRGPACSRAHWPRPHHGSRLCAASLRAASRPGHEVILLLQDDGQQ